MTCEIIQTGSDGNATVLGGEILIDCGVAFKKIQPYLDGLRLVLLSHIHSDHFNPGTVRRMAKQRPTLRWGCCEWMVQPLLDAGVDPRNIDVFALGGWGNYGTTFLSPFPLRHNVPNCGWHIHGADGSRTIYATDTGSLDGVEAIGYDLYLIEANHREEELEARMEAKLATGEFSYEAAAAENHLSYEAAVKWLTENMGPESRWIPMHGHKEKGSADE